MPELDEATTPGAGERAPDWAAILDDFERQLARVDLLRAELGEAGIGLPLDDLATGPELPTADPGPVPDALRARAGAVLAAQLRTVERLEGVRAELSRHLDATRTAAPPADAAVYLDRTA